MSGPACTRSCCLPVIRAWQCFGCGRRWLDPASLDEAGATLAGKRLTYDPKRARLVVAEGLCSPTCEPVEAITKGRGV